MVPPRVGVGRSHDVRVDLDSVLGWLSQQFLSQAGEVVALAPDEFFGGHFEVTDQPPCHSLFVVDPAALPRREGRNRPLQTAQAGPVGDLVHHSSESSGRW